jgi:putative peptidoglycan lipid II flippase
LLDGLARLPGLHMALGMASAVAAYVNLWLLWHWLKRAGVYQRQPGWARHLLRLAVACAAMVAVLLLGRWLWQDWTSVSTARRVWHLAVLVGAGGLTYVVSLFAMGFRLRELRGV